MYVCIIVKSMYGSKMWLNVSDSEQLPLTNGMGN